MIRAIAKIDINKDGKLDYEEFKEFLKHQDLLDSAKFGMSFDRSKYEDEKQKAMFDAINSLSPGQEGITADDLTKFTIIY